MNYEPKTESEVQEARMAPAGDYAFEVLEATDQISSKGNEMIKLVIGLYSGDTIRWKVFDYLLPDMAAKLRHCCDTLGILDQYQKGTVTAASFSGRAGHCKIIIQEDKNNQYPPKNAVKDYICRAAKPLGPHQQKERQPGEDELPEFLR